MSRFALREAIPLPPSFPPTEIGLMTETEFLHFRNPGSKFHPSSAYDFTILDLNRDYPRPVGGAGEGATRVTAEKLSGGYRVRHEDKVIAVIHNGVAYYDKPHLKSRIPKVVWDRDQKTDLGIASMKQVKYLSEVEPLVSPIAKLNEEKFPVVLQRIIVQGEPMTVRAEKPLAKDAGATIAVLNDVGLVVAMASDEWGATLLSVAQEYRGSGLGKTLGSYWYEHNPSYTSGGFTEAGRRNALALWRARVREFSARGWYSALVRAGRLTQERVNEILVSAKEPEREPRPAPKVLKATGEILVYADDVTFVVYDRAWLDEPEEAFIHGYGFFRGDTKRTFIYRIEYDRPFAELTTKVALQIAKNNGDTLYVGGGPDDLLELDGIPGIVRKGDFITVTRELAPVKRWAAKERRLRGYVDPYGEKQNLLLEMAESKWS